MSIDTDEELQAQREATEDLIASRPTRIALVRSAAARSDGAGGVIRIGKPVQLPPVDRYFGGVQLSIRSGIITHQGGHDQFGDVNESRWILAGPPNDDVQPGDTFTFDGRDFKVEKVATDRSYVTRATVLEVTGGN